MSAETNKGITEELLNRMPDDKGHFGPYGGRFVSETLMPSLLELEEKYLSLKDDPVFRKEFDKDMAEIGFKDRNSARDLAKTNMFPQVILSTVYTSAFVFVFYEMLNGNMDYGPQQATLITSLMGILTAGQVQILNFWFGSSHGSKRKTELSKA